MPRKNKIRITSLTEKVELAAQAVWEKILREHRETGEPIISSKNGKLAFLSPYDLQEVSTENFAIGEKKSEYKK